MTASNLSEKLKFRKVGHIVYVAGSLRFSDNGKFANDQALGSVPSGMTPNGYDDFESLIPIAITNKKTVTVSGKTDDVSSKPVTVTVNGATVTVGTDGTFTKDVTLAEGANTITIVAKDKAGKTTTVTRKVTVDTSAPVIKSVTLTPNPVDCGKTFIIAVEITD